MLAEIGVLINNSWPLRSSSEMFPDVGVEQKNEGKRHSESEEPFENFLQPKRFITAFRDFQQSQGCQQSADDQKDVFI